MLPNPSYRGLFDETIDEEISKELEDLQLAAGEPLTQRQEHCVHINCGYATRLELREAGVHRLGRRN